MADLLGRRAQSLIEWETRGVPREERASVERLLDLAELFRRRLILSRIPEIVRTPDAWLGNRTILETLRIDGVDPIFVAAAVTIAWSHQSGLIPPTHGVLEAPRRPVEPRRRIRRSLPQCHDPGDGSECARATRGACHQAL